MIKQLALCCLLLGASVIVKAQYFNQGTEPAMIRWKQINTPQFQVIFPAEAHEAGQKVASVLHQAYTCVGASLNHIPRKVSVVLHTHTVRSNGFVAWAPKRSEWYITPPQDLSNNDWLKHLGLHEYRHVVQTDKMYQGLSKVMTWIFGEQAMAYVSGMLPFWYLEGDAVWSETALSQSGRGRDPAFFKKHRTRLLSDESSYSFDQSVFGSYRFDTPNHYETGYLLTAYGRAKNGENGWANVQNKVARFPHGILPTPWPFSRAMKKQMGARQVGYYREVMDSLNKFWHAEKYAKDKPAYTYLTDSARNDYRAYLSPVWTEEGIYAIRKSFNDNLAIVSLRSGTEKVVCEPGPLIDSRITYAKGLLMWAEWRQHARWENIQYAEVWAYDTRRNSLFKVSDKTRWFSPALSPDGNRLAVVEITPQNQVALVLLNPFTGKQLSRQKSPNNRMLSRPVWSSSGHKVWCIELNGEQKQLRPYHVAAQGWGKPVLVGKTDVQWLQVSDSLLFYHASQSGLDQVYAISTTGNNITQITTDYYGIREFDINANGSNLIASRYNSQGSSLVSIPVNFSTVRSGKRATDYIPFQNAWKQEAQNMPKFSDTLFTVRKYRRWAHMFNIHSWVPLYADVGKVSQSADFEEGNQAIVPGITLLSQNKLSTLTSYISYGYGNRSHYLASGISYRGLLPVFQVEARTGENRQVYTSASADWLPSVSVNRKELTFRTYIPWQFSRGSFLTGIQPQVEYHWSNDAYYHYLGNFYLDGYDELESSLLVYAYKRKAVRDILPRYGGLLRLHHLATPKDEGLFGNLFYGYGILYLPGIFKNDGFRILAGYQEQDPGLYLMGSKLAFPRGYESYRTEQLFLLRSSYHFPVAYPDWSWGWFAYIKRMRMNLFYDYGRNQYQRVNNNRLFNITDNMHSIGSEFAIDAHFFRMILPVSVGIRSVFKPVEGELVIESFLNLQLNQF